MQLLKKALKATVWILGITAGLLIAIFMFLELMVGWGVESFSRKAMARFQGDRVEALIAVADCRTCRIEDRNHAVWALGQLRDKRALPLLYRYRTGKSCSHQTTICQYEISKAIRWTEGTSYMAPQLWRVMLSKDRSRPAKMHS